MISNNLYMVIVFAVSLIILVTDLLNGGIK